MKRKLQQIAFLWIISQMWVNLAYCQVTIQFNAAVYGQSLEGLSLAQILNSQQQELIGRITIKVREVKAGHVVTVVIPSFTLRQGNNMIDRVAFSKGRFLFGNNNYGLTLSQSGRFPEGEYEYCYEIDLSESKLPLNVPFFENCFVQELQPMTPLLLINPVDGEEDCNKRPQFIWQPPLPLPADARFRLVLAEIGDKQDIIEAINYNPPIINQGNIPVNQLNYPVNIQELKQGRRYAWQVTVYTGVTILKKSEIWVYMVKCPEENTEIITDSYREMKEQEDGNYYVANKVVRFSFNNPYNPGPLDYRVVSLANPDQLFKNLPKLNSRSGLNKFDLDLSDRREFKNGGEYLLLIKLETGRELKLRFTYTNE
ncbi:MAG: hypothetical protein ACTHMV_10315 [Chitinophagaceae bacterium]